MFWGVRAFWRRVDTVAFVARFVYCSQRGGKKTPNVQVVPTDPEKVEADKLARLAYAAKLRAIRVECMKEVQCRPAEA